MQPAARAVFPDNRLPPCPSGFELTDLCWDSQLIGRCNVGPFSIEEKCCDFCRVFDSRDVLIGALPNFCSGGRVMKTTSTCERKCTRTCEQPDIECPETCSYGVCYCPPERPIWHNYMCIRKEDCGKNLQQPCPRPQCNGYVCPHGFRFDPNGCMTCRCREVCEGQNCGNGFRCIVGETAISGIHGRCVEAKYCHAPTCDCSSKPGYEAQYSIDTSGCETCYCGRRRPTHCLEVEGSITATQPTTLHCDRFFYDCGLDHTGNPNCYARCTGGRRREKCGPTCELTCQLRPSPACPGSCISSSKCFCPSERPLWHNNQCVEQSQCPEGMLCCLSMSSVSVQRKGVFPLALRCPALL